ncbi:hypothetical protein ACFLZW_05370 [Chloroflexota bacterium]
MCNFQNIRMTLFMIVILLALTACGGMRGDPILPQEVVDAIAQESVKYYTNLAPEGSLLVETAKLETFWGQILPGEEEKYAEVICFKAEIQYFVQGIEQITFYQGLVKKPKASGIPWHVDDVSLDVWVEHVCGGDYMIRVTPTAVAEP